MTIRRYPRLVTIFDYGLFVRPTPAILTLPEGTAPARDWIPIAIFRGGFPLESAVPSMGSDAAGTAFRLERVGVEIGMAVG